MNRMSVGLVVKLSSLRWQRMLVVIIVVLRSAGCRRELDESKSRKKHEDDHCDKGLRGNPLRLSCH